MLIAAAKLANLPETADASNFNEAVRGVAKYYPRTTALRSHWEPVVDQPQLLRAVHDDVRFLRASLDEMRKGSKRPSDEAKWQALLDSAGASFVIFKASAIPAMTGIASTVGYALKLLADRAELRARFGCCKHPTCATKYFFVPPHSGRGRFRTDFCSVRHARTWAQLEYLKRQKAAKHK